jgi:DNA-binding transcriptional regulator YiaG
MLWRRRKHFTKQHAARIFEVSTKTIRLWETGEKFTDIPRVDLKFIRPYERCFLLRERNGIARGELAITLGVDKSTLVLWEQGQGNWSKLADFYKAAGWKIDNKDYRHYL